MTTRMVTKGRPPQVIDGKDRDYDNDNDDDDNDNDDDEDGERK